MDVLTSEETSDTNIEDHLEGGGRYVFTINGCELGLVWYFLVWLANKTITKVVEGYLNSALHMLERLFVIILFFLMMLLS